MTVETKNKDKTKQLLIDAVGTVLLRDGFQNLGINTVAKEANVSKVLIYRYFTNFDGLLEEFAKQKGYWINEGSEFTEFAKKASKDELKKAAPILFQNMFKELLQNKELQEIKRWELFEKNHITDTYGKQIEEIGIDQIKLVSKILNADEKDIQAQTAIIIAGLYYLVLRSKTTDVFNGINLQTKEGQERITQAIENIFNKLF